ncbi:MAG: putative lipid II flippase FtsW [Actinomycetota bacterium]|nr:putative lipid II flippase FtsW [Actinomycetota bacterium]
MATESRTIRAAPTRPRAKVALEGGHPAMLVSIAVGALLVLGLIMILSASFVSSIESYGSAFLFFKKQVMWAAIGVAAFIVFSRLDYRRLKGWGYVLLAVVIVLLFAVLIPGLGVMVGGSSRWLRFGPIQLQPSELAKLALVLFAADVFSRKEERKLRQFSHTFLPLIPALGFLALLVMAQPDMGTTLLLGVIGMGMLFVAGAPARYLLGLGVVGAAGAITAALGEAYRRERILAFLDPWSDPLNTGYQTIQSLIAMGSGGWFGVGLGASRQKWLYVPNAHTDFIYAILGEELGLFGTLVVLGLFAFLGYLGIRIARAAPDRFGMLVATGITIWITSQALVNIGAVTGALPITGVPLPLVSFGGSSLVVSLIGMGILVNIARQSKFVRTTKR